MSQPGRESVTGNTFLLYTEFRLRWVEIGVIFDEILSEILSCRAQVKVLTQFHDPASKIATCTINRWRSVSSLVRPSIHDDGLTKLKRTNFPGFPGSKLVLVRPGASIKFPGTLSDRSEEADGVSDTDGCTTLLKHLVVSVFPVDDIAVDVCNFLGDCKQVGFITIVAMMNRSLIAVRCCNVLKFPVVPKVTQLLVISRVQQALNGVIDYSTGNFARQVKPSTSCWRSEQCFAG